MSGTSSSTTRCSYSIEDYLVRIALVFFLGLSMNSVAGAKTIDVCDPKFNKVCGTMVDDRLRLANDLTRVSDLDNPKLVGTALHTGLYELAPTLGYPFILTPNEHVEFNLTNKAVSRFVSYSVWRKIGDKSPPSAPPVVPIVARITIDLGTTACVTRSYVIGFFSGRLTWMHPPDGERPGLPLIDRGDLEIKNADILTDFKEFRHENIVGFIDRPDVPRTQPPVWHCIQKVVVADRYSRLPH